MLPSLPDDALFEILSWVPVKPACRFRCVSRGWRMLISSPVFLATHKSRAGPLLLSITTSSPPEVNSTLQFMDIEGNIVRVIKKPGLWTIKYSFNGFVCVCIAGYYVSVIDLTTCNVVSTLAELNHELFCSLNVGCAVPSRKYKVVCLMSKYDPCKVLTLEDGAKWRQLQSPPTPSLVTNNYCLGSAVTINGVMHFLYEVLIPQVKEDYVLGFDLEREEWNVCFKGPPRSSDKLEYKCMFNLNDALCMVQWSSINICHIWVLTDSAKGTWVNVYTIPMPPTFDLLRPLMVMRDGRKLRFYMCNRFNATPTLQIYDPVTRTCAHLMKFASNLLGNSGICVLHLESFVSPKILPISSPSMLSRLTSCQWLRRLDPRMDGIKMSDIIVGSFYCLFMCHLFGSMFRGTRRW